LVKDLCQMRETITHELRRVRAYLVDMREPPDEIGSLGELVQQTVEPFASRTGIAIDTRVHGDVANLSGAVVRELAPVLREALTNVEKHAHASRVSVSIWPEGRQLRLRVQDDGVGIDRSGLPAGPPGERSGQGVYSMRERARLLGGNLTLERLASGGTAVTVSVPLPVPAAL